MAKSFNEVHILRTMKDERQNEETLVWTRSERQRWLVQMALGTCALYASRVSVPLVMPAMAAEQHWSKTEAGTVLSSFFWGFTMTQVLSGYLSDRFGGERVLAVAALGWSLATLAIPHVVRCYSHPASWALVALRVLHGACQGFHYPSLSSLSSRRLSEHERGPFFSVATAGTAVGAVIAGTAGSALLVFYGWPAVFRFIGGCGVAWVLVLRFVTMASDRENNLVALPSKLCIPDVMNGTKPLPEKHWITILKNKAFWSSAIAHACQNNCFFIMLSWLPTYFHDNFPDGQGWVFNVVPWIFLIPSTLYGRELSDWLLAHSYSVTNTRKIIESICLLTQALGLSAIAFMDQFASAVFCATLVIAASGFHNNAIIVNPQDLAPQHSGSVFGLMNMVGAIPGFVGVYFAGYILESTHSWANVFFTTAAINILGCAIFVIFGSGVRVI